MLLYTDGVTEARTADGEQFGLDRLIDLLEREAASGRTAEELLRRLVRAVRRRATRCRGWRLFAAGGRGEVGETGGPGTWNGQIGAARGSPQAGSR